MSRFGLTIVLSLCFCISAQAAVKKNLSDYYPRHTVKKGESLTAISKKYYGATWKSVYIKATNRVAAKTPIKAGAKLKIPEVIVHKVKKGETLGKIAKRYYKTSELASFLRWGNSLKKKSKLKVGQSIRIPFTLRHTIRKGDTLDKISERYYRSKSMVKYLSSWNKLKGNSDLKKRRHIWLAVRKGIQKVKKADKEKPAAKRVRRIKPPKGYDLSSMVYANELVNEAQYKKALDVMRNIPIGEFRRRKDLRNYFWQITVCLIALGQPSQAKRVFRRYIKAGGKRENLNPSFDDLSPKIQQVIGPMLVVSKDK